MISSKSQFLPTLKSSCFSRSKILRKPSTPLYPLAWNTATSCILYIMSFLSRLQLVQNAAARLLTPRLYCCGPQTVKQHSPLYQICAPHIGSFKPRLKTHFYSLANPPDVADLCLSVPMSCLFVPISCVQQPTCLCPFL